MGDVLVDDPEAFLVGGEDEAVAQLAQGLEGGERVEGRRRNAFPGGGKEVVIADGHPGASEAEAAGGGGDDGLGEGKAVYVPRLDRAFALHYRLVRVKDRLIKAGQGAHVDGERFRGGGGGVQGAEEAGRGPGFHQRGADGVADEIVHKGRLAEADLGFGGVHVDVELLRREFEEEEDDRKTGGRDDVAVGLGEGVEDEAIADEAAVGKDVNGVAVELLQLGLGDEAGEADKAGFGGFVVLVTLPGWGFGQAGAAEVDLGGDGEEGVEGFAAEDLVEALAGIRRRRGR